MLKNTSSKLLLAGVLFSFYACGTSTTTTETPTSTETTTEASTEIQKAVNAEANSETENLEYAEKAEANQRAIAFYEALKNGLYESTPEFVEQNKYKNFSETSWIEMLKTEVDTKGKIERYELQKSKYEKVEGTNSERKVEIYFEVTRNGKKYIEEMEWVKTDGEPFLLTDLEYKKAENTSEDDD